MPKGEDETGAGKTKTEALAGRQLVLKIDQRRTRGIGRPASFLTKNKVHNTSGPGQHDSADTNRGKVSWNSVRLKQEPENGSGGDQV